MRLITARGTEKTRDDTLHEVLDVDAQLLHRRISPDILVGSAPRSVSDYEHRYLPFVGSSVGS